MPAIALIAAMLLRLRVGRITPHGTPDWTRTGVLRPSSACTKDGRRTKNARIPYGSRRNSDRCQKSPGRSTISRPSQTLTSPQRVRYSTPMATRWSDEQRTHALDQLANGHTLAETHAHLGPDAPSVSTLSRWAKAEGIDVVQRQEAKTREATGAAQRKWAEVRAELADQSGDAARRLLAIISRAIDSGDLGITSARDAKDAATAMAILIDKAQVLVGDASDIRGHLGLQAQVLEQAEQHATHLRAVV